MKLAPHTTVIDTGPAHESISALLDQTPDKWKEFAQRLRYRVAGYAQKDYQNNPCMDTLEDLCCAH